MLLFVGGDGVVQVVVVDVASTAEVVHIITGAAEGSASAHSHYCHALQKPLCSHKVEIRGPYIPCYV